MKRSLCLVVLVVVGCDAPPSSRRDDTPNGPATPVPFAVTTGLQKPTEAFVEFNDDGEWHEVFGDEPLEAPEGSTYQLLQLCEDEYLSDLGAVISDLDRLPDPRIGCALDANSASTLTVSVTDTYELVTVYVGGTSTTFYPSMGETGTIDLEDGVYDIVVKEQSSGEPVFAVLEDVEVSGPTDASVSMYANAPTITPREVSVEGAYYVAGYGITRNGTAAITTYPYLAEALYQATMDSTSSRVAVVVADSEEATSVRGVPGSGSFENEVFPFVVSGRFTVEVQESILAFRLTPGDLGGNARAGVIVGASFRDEETFSDTRLEAFIDTDAEIEDVQVDFFGPEVFQNGRFGVLVEGSEWASEVGTTGVDGIPHISRYIEGDDILFLEGILVDGDGIVLVDATNGP